jgi:beta-aspartyl-dipeptidase (metallo-type)
MQLSMNTRNGVTTAVGLLGTDALTRTVKNLYAKTRSFDEEGITALMLTGSYWVPSPTITGNVADDLVYLDKCIGLKIAIADVRGPVINAKELAELAAAVRVSALVSGKPGIITVHLGAKPERLNLVKTVVEEFGIRADMFVLTHVNRQDELLLEQAFDLASKGAFLDATGMVEESLPGSPSIHAADFAVLADKAGLYNQVSFSSDAGGSMPHWDKDRKNITGMSIATPDSLSIELSRLVNQKGFTLEKALLPLTETPARIYNLSGRKGRLFEGADADILVLARDGPRPETVIAKGVVMVRNSKIVKKGYFE